MIFFPGTKALDLCPTPKATYEPSTNEVFTVPLAKADLHIGKVGSPRPSDPEPK